MTLSEREQNQAEELLQSFANRMRDLADEVIGEVYVELLPYIATDTWSNVRTRFVSDLTTYPQICEHSKFDAKELRKSMLAEYHDEIVNDTIEDLQEQIEDLRDRLDDVRQWTQGLL